MNIGLFGGTFDPIHNGHLALAQAAKERCSLRRIYFVPANMPPHKQMQPLSPYFDRYAMVVLATLGEKAFVPSPLEAPNLEALAPTHKTGSSHQQASGANYSIDTVHRLKNTLERSDRLFFLI